MGNDSDLTPAPVLAELGSTSRSRFRLRNALGPPARRRMLEEAHQQLSQTLPEVSPKWLYDERGSELFEAITELPEYYPTRREREILVRRAPTIARMAGAETLIELGSGSAEKTRLLLDSLSSGDKFWRFVPFDVSEPAIRKAAVPLLNRYPRLFIDAYVADFEHDLLRIPEGSNRLIIFLGGTIGNLTPAHRQTFFAQLSSVLRRGDWFLLGTDLIKDPARLHAAYNDAAGVTAEFNKNILRVLNRELGADFQVDRFEHRAFYDPTSRWIEMRLRSLVEQDVRIPLLKLNLHFAPGAELLTEISAKFRLSDVENELRAAGLELREWWTDDAGDFALSLAAKS